VTPSRRLQEISFDLYERYILLEHMGKLFRPHGSKYRVLDVGGHRAAFWPGFSSLAGLLIPEASVVVADIVSTSELQNYVQASGVRLPFRDGAFDFVCAIDTFDHIPAEDRPAFLAELLRVTRDGLYLLYPFDSAGNRWAESVVAEFAVASAAEHADTAPNDPVPAWLEHRRLRLPSRDSAAQILSRTPHSWIGFELGNTDVWLLMMLTYHSLRIPGTDFVLELNRRFNQAYTAQIRADPAYRAGYLLSKRRGVADLEAARDSFMSAGNRADLQGVLAFCQLFLSIAQNGRAAAAKDRHIHRIEDELANVKNKWSETAAVLRDLEAVLLEPPETVSPEGAVADWPRDRISQLLDAALALRTGARTEFAAQLEAIRERIDSLQTSQIAALDERMERVRQQIEGFHLGIAQIPAQLELIREQIGGLQGRLEFQARLDGRMRDLEIGLVTNRRAIQAVYDSRIWKMLCRAGALLLRLTGRAAEPNRGASWTPPRDGVAHPSGSPRPGAPEEFLALACDHPADGTVLAARDVVEMRGWALAASGIDRVLIAINGDPPVAASYGIPRPDVARGYPEIPNSSLSGYRFFWDTNNLPEGPCTVRVTAVARSGETRETVCHISIDWQTPPGYGVWIARNEPGVEDLRQMRLDAANFGVRPRISIAVPVYQTPIALLTRCIESVLDQTYPEWELCLADDGSHDPALASLLQEYARRDPRIRVVTLPENRGISSATNAALQLCTGDYAAFLDHDDELAAFALFEVVRAINGDPAIDLYYSDEDKLDEHGRRYDAFFKPDWSPDLFRSCNYLCHFVVLKRTLLERLGGLDANYRGAQDYDLLLRASEHTQKIKRIAKVLYHWRAVAGSTAKALAEKPEASMDGERALTAYLERNAPGAQVEETAPCRYRVHYPIAGDPQVSILIPTGGHRNVFRALEEVLGKTAYKHYDIILIDNSRAAHVKEYAGRLAQREAPVRYFDWRGKPFNFSRMNNEAARSTTSPYILFLNDDTTIIAPEWLSAMLEHAQRAEVGAVGAQLRYPNNAIQHAGVVMGLYGNCSHAFKGVPGELPHYYFDFPNLIRNCSAVTAACLLVAREKFFEAGAFDDVNLAVAFQDVDLCLKLLELGYRNVYTPYAKLYHYESATKTEKDKIPDAAEDAFMKNKWAKYIADDPYYNPNLARRKEDFSLALD
jgi:GT2 family glycosyltransferase/SAM-dependent methyltransferase